MLDGCRRLPLAVVGAAAKRGESMRFLSLSRALIGVSLPALALSGCASGGGAPNLPPASFVSTQEGPGEEYVIGPLDDLTIFVWRNPDLGAKVQVRPDGRSEEHTSELQSLMRISYAVFCLKKKNR